MSLSKSIIIVLMVVISPQKFTCCLHVRYCSVYLFTTVCLLQCLLVVSMLLLHGLLVVYMLFTFCLLLCLLVCLLYSTAENVDFASSSDSIDFQPGDTKSCVEIAITDDMNQESNEPFSIDFSFSLPPGTPVPPPITAMVTIVDNDMSKYLGD